MAAPFRGRSICGKNCQQVPAGFARRIGQELPTNVGQQTFVTDAAKNELVTTKPVHSGRERPPKPKGFWRDTNAKNGVAPGHKMFFAASDFGLLTIALRSFSMP